MIGKFFPLFLFLLIPRVDLLAESSPFRVDVSEKPVSIGFGETKNITLIIRVPPGHFIYKEKTKVQTLRQEDMIVGEITYPPSQIHIDPFFKKELKVFEGETVISVPVRAPPDGVHGRRNVELLTELQGCSQKLCYPLESHLTILSFDVGGIAAAVDVPETSKKLSWRDLIRSNDFDIILGRGLWVVLAVVFLGGFLTSLTPCVLPLIPITLMIIGIRAETPVKRDFFLSLVLVLGISLTYAALGIFAVGLGEAFGFVFQQRWFLILLALLFLALALSMFGLFDLHLPHFIRERLNRIEGHGLWGAFASGMAAGLLAAPCAGPVIIALLLFVSSTQSYIEGFSLLFVYGLGMGVLFIVLGTFYGALQGRFRGGNFTRWMKYFIGVMMLIGALFYMNALVPLSSLLPKSFQQESLIVWQTSEPQTLTLAKQQNKSVLIDFYAEWCAPCKEYDLHFFRKPEVVELLQELIPLRIDATFSDDPEVARLIKKYGVIGWPTILFLSPEGELLEDLSVVSYAPDLLLERLREVVNK